MRLTDLRGRTDDARAALIRLRSKSGHAGEIEETLAMIIHTSELEALQTAGTSYRDCFRTAVDRRRTELTVMVWLIQQTSGSPMIGWGTYFMTQVGLSEPNAYTLGVAQSAMAFVGTVGSWFLMPHFGRRTLYLWGQGVMFIGLIAIGKPCCSLLSLKS
jgi:SP family general alpha glucoside:H+ symporter-like MFS transporter